MLVTTTKTCTVALVYNWDVFTAAIRFLSIKTVLSSLLHAFGVLWLVVETAAFFSPDFSESAKTYWLLFLIIGSLVGLFRAWPRLSVSASVAGTDCNITIRVCDLFTVNDVAYVVSTNTTFDTALEDGTIDADSVQGQFTTRLCSSREKLDRDIAHSLEGVQSTLVGSQEKSYGKLQRYEVGTVASILVQNKRAPGYPFNRTHPGLQFSRGGSLEGDPGSAGARAPRAAWATPPGAAWWR